MRRFRWSLGVLGFVPPATGCEVPWWRILNTVAPKIDPSPAPITAPEPHPSDRPASPRVATPGCSYGHRGNQTIESWASHTSAGQPVEAFRSANRQTLSADTSHATNRPFDRRPAAAGGTATAGGPGDRDGVSLLEICAPGDDGHSPTDTATNARTIPRLLEAAGIGRRVGDRWLWRGLDAKLVAGEVLAVTGPSGSGKTLLLRALAGLDPIDEGKIAFAGRPLRAWPMPRYRAQVVYLPQRAVALEGSVEADLRRPFHLRVHRTTPFPRERALAWLAEIGRDATFLKQPSEALSGGEAQIVALMRALLLQPRVLLLDEPTASLDDATARRIEGLVRAWVTEVPSGTGPSDRAEARGRAAVWTSHHGAQLDRVAGRCLRLGDPR